MFTAMPLGLIYSGRALGKSKDRGFAMGGFILSVAVIAFFAIAFLMSLVMRS